VVGERVGISQNGGSVTSDEIRDRIIAGEGTGEAFDRFRREAHAGLRAEVQQVRPQPARDLLRTYTIRAATVERAGIPGIGFAETLEPLRDRGDQEILGVAFTGGAWAFMVFADPDGTPFGCIVVPHREPAMPEGLVARP
jgi:hypothetical protein